MAGAGSVAESAGQTQSAVGTTESAYGAKYEMEGSLLCPDGRLPLVRSAWQIDKDGLERRCHSTDSPKQMIIRH